MAANSHHSHRPVLTTSQAACLSALRDGNDTTTSIAIRTRLDLRKATTSLRKLEELGLARRGEMNTWLMTMRGKKCRFRTVPETTRQGNKSLGPGLRRLLDALDRPMRGRELAKKMGVTKQNVHHQIVKLYSLGQVRLGDPGRLLLIVSRINDAPLRMTQSICSEPKHDFAIKSIARLNKTVHTPAFQGAVLLS